VQQRQKLKLKKYEAEGATTASFIHLFIHSVNAVSMLIWKLHENRK